MFDLKIDPTPFVNRTIEMNAAIDQLPYVFSRLLNDAAFAARRVLVEQTWPSHVMQRNKSFLSASLHVDKATKASLQVTVYDKLKHGHLEQLARGGSVRPMRARRFAIPMPGMVRRTSQGVASHDRPAQVIARTPPKALRITPRGIFVAQGGKLRLMYALKPSVVIRATVPFYEDFEYTINAEMRTGFAKQMKAAMATRKG